MLSVVLLAVLPSIPDVGKLSRVSVYGQVIASTLYLYYQSEAFDRTESSNLCILFNYFFLCLAVALFVSIVVGSHSIPVAFTFSVITSIFHMVIMVFPYSVVGIICKEMQESVHGFNNNGLYVGVLSTFAATSDLTVQVYGTARMAAVGTGNVMTLPLTLFVIGCGCTIAFKWANKL